MSEKNISNIFFIEYKINKKTLRNYMINKHYSNNLDINN